MYHLLQIMIMSHLHFFGDIPACSPSIRSRLHFRTCPTSRDGLFVSYHIYPDSRTSFSSFFTMYIMHISFYIGQWPCYHQHLFPTLNRHLYPVPKYGTNQKAYDRTTLILPAPLLMLFTFPHLTSLKKKPSWMSCWNPIFQNHINMLLLRPDPSKLSTTASTPPKRKQKAKATPKAPVKRRRHHEQSRFRSSSPLTTWTTDEKQKLRTLKSDEKSESRFSWRVISTKMGKTEADVRSMWNKLKDQLG